jgi:hypothetical protein
VFELEPDWIVPDRHVTWHGKSSFPALVRQRLVRGSKVSQYYVLGRDNYNLTTFGPLGLLA